MLNKLCVSGGKPRSERSSELAAVFDITSNSASIEIFDTALNRTYSRTALYGVKITADNACDMVERLFTTAIRRANVPLEVIKGAVFSADVYISDVLEQKMYLGLKENAEIAFVPYISARVGGRFTASLLAIPESDFLAVDVGSSLCVVEKQGDELKCAGFSLAGAFDGTALESGMASENGAIDAVRRESGKTVAYEVVGDTDSVGISPTGAVCAARIMLSEGIIDADGIMTDRDLFAIGEDLFVSQSDIRAIQTDKAKCAAVFDIFSGENLNISNTAAHFAIFSGENLYLSGAPFSNDEGFRAMSAIGALPKTALKANFCKNASSKGALKYLISEKSREKAEYIIKHAVDVSEEFFDEFDRKYFEHLSFGGCPHK